MKSYVNQWDLTKSVVEGAAQRVHEDTQRFASGLNGCMVVVLDALFTLVVFVPILVDLGERIVSPTWATMLGSYWIVALAAFSATIALIIAATIGRRLVGLEIANQRVEARLRHMLVVLEMSPHVGVHSDVHSYVHNCMHNAVHNGVNNNNNNNNSDDENPPANVFVSTWNDLYKNYHNLFLSFMYLNTWLTTFEQYVVMLPYMVAAPLLFAPEPVTITLGTLVKLSNAFGKVFGSFNIVGDNWASINDFCSCVVRLREFEKSISRDIASRTSTWHSTLIDRRIQRSTERDVNECEDDDARHKRHGASTSEMSEMYR